MRRTFSHVVGIDDFPFERSHRGDVRIVGTVFAGSQLHGVVSSRVRRDGANATTRIAAMVYGSKFREHLQLVMLQGIAVAGFNVVDLARLERETGLPVLVVARRNPDLDAIRDALLTRVPGGKRKWALIQAAGPMRRAGEVWVQSAGLSAEETSTILERFAINGVIPEPLRVAHLIAGGIATGESTGRV
ncbi:MAG: DUF99 family protein [Thermoanaerobaculia bacterium]